jgi:hypothetical protein
MMLKKTTARGPMTPIGRRKNKYSSPAITQNAMPASPPLSPAMISL